MLKVSYDTKPLRAGLDRIRLNVIDGFINEEKIFVSGKIDSLVKSGKFSPMRRKNIKNKYDKYIEKLDEMLEIKREFQIRLRCFLSFRKPESEFMKFTKRINESNKFVKLKL